ARTIKAVDVYDRAPGNIVHPLRIAGSERGRGVAPLESEQIGVVARAAIQILDDDVHMIERIDAHGSTPSSPLVPGAASCSFRGESSRSRCASRSRDPWGTPGSPRVFHRIPLATLP